MEAENAQSSGKRPADGEVPDCTEQSSGKKRRKQLNPVRHVPDSLPSHMVQVPKDDVVDGCSEPVLVPLVKPPRCPLRDVPFQNENLADAAAINVPNPDSGPSGLGPFNMIPPLPFAYQPWTDRTQKIFNQEAYCELCKKEFCNKYFLKTHKANKHGIYSTDSNGSVRQYNEPSVAVTAVESHDSQQAEADDKQRAFCDLCHKSFCNKYFVRRHKSKSHGIEEVDDLNGVQIFSTNNARSTLDKSVSPESEFLFENDDKEEPLNLVLKDGDNSNESPPDDCTENLEKLQTMLQRLRPEVADALDNTDESSEAEATAYKPDMDQPPVVRKHNNPTSSYCEICNKELCNKYFMRTHMQRMHGIELEHGAQIGGVVCNICNKELCSKYFLRVHKQNTHGIPGPTGLPVLRPETKTSPKPAFSQSCVICSKRFRSSKWLQAHLQSDHQVQNEPQSNAPLDVISKLFWEGNREGSGTYNCSHCSFSTPVLAFLFVHERSHVVGTPESMEDVKPSQALQELIHQKTFWQHAITHLPSAGLDLTHRAVSDRDS